jgi:WD40 repeat protein
LSGIIADVMSERESPRMGGSEESAVFEVAIGPGAAQGLFRVEVLRSPAGEASAVVELPAGELLARRGEVQSAVLLSAVLTRRVLQDTELPVREVGQLLFAALLGTGEVAGIYRASAAVAADREQALRVVLRIDDPELAALPWEAMYDPAVGGYVCRHEQLVRQVPVASVQAPLTVQPPLRILGVVSSPRGMGILDTDRERDLLGAALARSVADGRAEVTWAPDATWAGLHDLLMAGPWHVLHFVGHGGFDSEADEGVLILTKDDGRPDVVEASQFADLLRQARPAPRLVVLNSCSGATGGSGDLFAGTAAALTRAGVPAVAAMQFEITDTAATAFARGFYAALARSRGVDEAVSAGRIAILGTTRRTLEWVTPVLYLRGHHASLFASLAAPMVPASGSDATSAGGQRVLPGRSAGVDGPSRCLRAIVGHTSGVRGVAFSPDGTLLATASSDGTGRLWNPATGTCLHILTGHASFVNATAFNQRGTMLATASEDGTTRLWNPATGTCLRTLIGHTFPVWGVGFSPLGSLLATASWDMTARLWDPAQGTRECTLKGHTSPVWWVAFSPDGTVLATASDDGTARLWDVAHGTCLRTLNGHVGSLRGVAFSPDGTVLATASTDQTARLWDPASGSCLRTLTGHTGSVNGVAFSPDGTALATASTDQTARVWDRGTGTCLRTLAGHTGSVNGVAFSPDGRSLATASADQAVRLWQ